MPPVVLEEDAELKFEDVPDSPAVGKRRALSTGVQDSVDSDALAKLICDAIATLERGLVALGYEEDDAGSVGEDLADAGFSDAEPDLPLA